MKTQFKILMFIVCLNLATGMALALAVPGTSKVPPRDPAGTQSNATEYEEHFNSTKIAKDWRSKGVDIPIIGDLFAGFQFLALHWDYLLDGFPMFIELIGNSFLIDESGRIAFFIITNAIRALYAILMAMFFIEFISGRHVLD